MRQTINIILLNVATTMNNFNFSIPTTLLTYVTQISNKWSEMLITVQGNTPLHLYMCTVDFKITNTLCTREGRGHICGTTNSMKHWRANQTKGFVIKLAANPQSYRFKVDKKQHQHQNILRFDCNSHCSVKMYRRRSFALSIHQRLHHKEGHCINNSFCQNNLMYFFLFGLLSTLLNL